MCIILAFFKHIFNFNNRLPSLLLKKKKKKLLKQQQQQQKWSIPFGQIKHPICIGNFQ